MKKILFITLLVAVVTLPLLVFAQTPAAISINPNLPGINNVSTAGPCGWIVGFYNFALIIAGILAFGAVVFGGILYATSAGNASKQSEGRSWITSALIGILLLAAAYLILNTVNPNLTKCSLPSLSGVAANSIGGGSGSSGGGSTTGGGTGSGGSGSTGGAIPSKVASAALAYKGANTSGGPSGGVLACAWAVNNVLTNAGIAKLDANSVQAMESALTSGRGTLITDQSQAQPGDIVIQGQDGHVGICLNVGCSQVISNSSGKSSFSWVSNNTFSGTGSNYSSNIPSRIYQINN